MRVWLPERLSAELRREAAITYPQETGGVLMGYESGADLVVTCVIGPGPKAIHGRNSFVPDYDFQEAEIARVYGESKRASTYLGDWHTHPRGSDSLSDADRKTLKAISNCAEARIEKPVMVILWGSDRWSITAWRGMWSRPFFRYQKFQLSRMEVVEFCSEA